MDVRKELQTLNECFLHSCQSAVKDNKDALLVPLVKDYLVYVRELLKPEDESSRDNGFSSLGAFFQKLESCMVSSNKNSNESDAVALKSGFSSTSTAQPQQSSTKWSSNNNAVTMPFASPAAATSNADHISNTSFGNNSSAALKSDIPRTSTTILFPTATFNFLNKSACNGSNVGGGSTSTVVAPTAAAVTGMPPPATGGGGDNQGEEEDEKPPENKFVPVEESDSVHTVKCKLFAKLESGYKDKGVGMLHLKKIDGDKTKYQLVIRANNQLGTVMLNMLIQKDLPVTRKSDKDILTIDPTGDKGSPLPILIRVKTKEDAEDLTTLMEKFKSEIS